MLRGPDGKLWLGGQPELGYLENGRFVSIPLPKEIASSTGDTQTMTIGAGGALWLQAVNNSPVMRWRPGVWSVVPDTAGIRDSAVILATDDKDRVWSGYLGGYVVIYDGDKVTKLAPGDQESVDNVTALHQSGPHQSAAILRHFRGAVRRPGADAGNISIYRFPQGKMWMIPLPDEVISVGAVCRPAYLKERKGRTVKFLWETLRQNQALA